jgi:hypothetical protein
VEQCSRCANVVYEFHVLNEYLHNEPLMSCANYISSGTERLIWTVAFNGFPSRLQGGQRGGLTPWRKCILFFWSSPLYFCCFSEGDDSCPPCDPWAVKLYETETLNNAIKGCVHRLMQRPGLCSLFRKKKWYLLYYNLPTYCVLPSLCLYWFHSLLDCMVALVGMLLLVRAIISRNFPYWGWRTCSP